MATRPDPVLPADDAGRALSRDLLAAAHAALSYLEAENASPGISRIAFGLCPDGVPMTLISALAPHSAGLRAHPACALLLGEPGAKGDPLTHPRLMLQARAEFVAPNAPDRPGLRAHWLARHPKSKLYIDFADFAFVRLHPVSALLNGGFGRAFRLTPADLV
ncbi:MAG: pyridoxamine 5-phosphate oxidase [Pseudotabrizicola sp.]|uniref:HugZ family pyridoxamine 5'-phosphate oxidase n=1 Tax=Pseudotabrizicola sp. TaxID=2939647 RepID=UPI002725F638|nr:pyridoxamine 5-phosphate oxidase [Pseudotabrizicola sp.]MDO9641367.1 pyridoxamine 5-phosphate oxidase [Pseudotabrizicola sp.]